MASILYFAMLGFLLTHELDAVKRHEWRMLPLLSRLDERVGEQIFILAHVPLIGGLFYFGAGHAGSDGANAVAVFAIIHVVLHWLFRRHPANEFDNPGSWILILGAGFTGFGYLLAG